MENIRLGRTQVKVNKVRRVCSHALLCVKRQLTQPTTPPRTTQILSGITHYVEPSVVSILQPPVRTVSYFC